MVLGCWDALKGRLGPRSLLLPRVAQWRQACGLQSLGPRASRGAALSAPGSQGQKWEDALGLGGP